jgi:trans-2,3-dihydro-3-hydroxyanthranilate isomerase
MTETVNVAPPAAPGHRASIRIFTPGREIPFAGHPTVGTAVLLGVLDRNGESGSLDLVLEETVGLVPCAIEIQGPDRGHGTSLADHGLA